MEIRKAPNGTAALGFVANSEAARHVFVVVVVHDAMITGRRYGTFVLASSVIKRGGSQFGAIRGAYEARLGLHVAQTPAPRGTGPRSASWSEKNRVLSSARVRK